MDSLLAYIDTVLAPNIKPTGLSYCTGAIVIRIYCNAIVIIFSLVRSGIIDADRAIQVPVVVDESKVNSTVFICENGSISGSAS